MKYKAIIFDMDGTIVDTENIWKTATNNLIASKGISITPQLELELSNKLRGIALIKSCQIIKEMTNIQDPLEDLINQKTQIACSLYDDKLKFIEGFLKFHKNLSKYKVKSGIATNADDLTLNLTKKTLNLEKFFGKHIYNISFVNNLYKPNPALYLYIAQQLEIDPKDCLAIEDSGHGIRAAKAAGMFCIGINTAKNKELLCESDMIVDGYSEIKLNELL